MYDGIDLIEGTDYVIDSYTKNLNAGTGTVTLKGINNYTGTKKVNFKITPVVYADYEEEFDIEIDAEEVVSENFETVDAITALVKKCQGN